MTKDKSGITIISLVVTIIVMLIIMGITLISGTTLLNRSKLTKIEMMLMLVKAKAEMIIEEVDFARANDFDEIVPENGTATGIGNYYGISSNSRGRLSYNKLVEFSLLIDRNQSPTIYTRSVYRTWGATNWYEDYLYPDGTYASQIDVSLHNNRPFRPYQLSFENMYFNIDKEHKVHFYKNEDFISLVDMIFPKNTYEYATAFLGADDHISSASVPYNSALLDQVSVGALERYFYVKWGLDECVSKGVIASKHNPEDGSIQYSSETHKVDTSIVDNSDKYIIVEYDLINMNVAGVAYSKGFRKSDGSMVYKLDEMLKIDKED